MSAPDRFFGLLDTWRHLPDYQLERRADVFFAVHLVPFLEQRFSVQLFPELVPEFPIRIGTIYPRIPINQSFKIDYLALARDHTKCFFVELKTDGHSRREKQDKYLAAARAAGLQHLLEGLLLIFQATTAKHKYYNLLCLLERIGLLTLPPSLHEVMCKRRVVGSAGAAQGIRVCPLTTQAEIVYLQPHGGGPNEIGFTEFAERLPAGVDPWTDRFRQSLVRWAEQPAGHMGD